jgi:meso-butanediol dehydrogenase/(S,S)-butanediol dehydrogenase/diacetyl reductase
MLSGKTVVVTGAGSGVGRGIALAVAEAGGRVVATDLDPSAAQETVSIVRDEGGEAVAASVDVTLESAVSQAIAMAVERFGALDGWVNNAGVLKMGPAIEMSERDWTVQFEVNARAVCDCSCLAAKQMIAQGNGGSIVNVASNAGKVGYPNMAAYNASKAAVISLTRSHASEWAAHRINVNAVCPGGVETPMLTDVAEWIGEREGIEPEQLLPMMKPAQLGRHIQPIEVGRVVTFLLSDQAAIIRGQAINVDGGDTPY